MFKKLLLFLAKFRRFPKSDNNPPVYYEVGAWGGLRLRYRSWADVEKKFHRQFKAARELALKQKSNPLQDTNRLLRDARNLQSDSNRLLRECRDRMRKP